MSPSFNCDRDNSLSTRLVAHRASFLMADIPHPFLAIPRLYVSHLSPDVTDGDIARFFETCVPVRPQIRLDPRTNTMSGTFSS